MVEVEVAAAEAVDRAMIIGEAAEVLDGALVMAVIIQATDQALLKYRVGIKVLKVKVIEALLLELTIAKTQWLPPTSAVVNPKSHLIRHE